MLAALSGERDVTTGYTAGVRGEPLPCRLTVPPGSWRALVSAAEHAEAEVLVVGPAQAKLQLIKHIHAHDPAMSSKIVGVETIDHPSDGQLVAYARKYFVAKDQMLSPL